MDSWDRNGFEEVYECWGALSLNNLIWIIFSTAIKRKVYYILQLERFDTVYLRKMSICGACGDNHCGSARCCRCLDDDRLCRLLTEAALINEIEQPLYNGKPLRLSLPSRKV